MTHSYAATALAPWLGDCVSIHGGISSQQDQRHLLPCTYCERGSDRYCGHPVSPASQVALHASTCSLMALGCTLEKSCRCLDTDPSSAHLMGVGQSQVGPRMRLLPPSGHLQSLVLPLVQSEHLSPSSSRQTASKVRREGTYHKANVFPSAFPFV